MIPEELMDFVHGPVFIVVGSRSARLMPRVLFARGATASPDRTALTVLVPEATAGPLAEDLADNGRIAVTIAHPATHATYQFKGRAREVRPATESEAAVMEISLDKLRALIRAAGLDDVLLAGLRLSPAVAVTFAVDEVYLQTPGPKAGTRIA